MVLTSLEKAIILTISYSNIFEYPLTLEEITKRMISNKKVLKKIVSQVLSSLVNKNILKVDQEFYYLKNTKVASRNERKSFSQKKKTEAKLFYSKAKLIPFIKAIAITGSLSVNNAKENDDIDWLIICQNNTLWLVRPLVIFLALIHGKRRERDGHHRDNSWCFNMFLTEETLTVLSKKRSVFSAFEVCQADFVYDQGGIEMKFLHDNDWVKNYLKNYYNQRLSKLKKSSHLNITRTSFYLQLLNKVFFLIQYSYMKSRITREVVTINKALFHPRDTQFIIKKEWKRILQNV